MSGRYHRAAQGRKKEHPRVGGRGVVSLAFQDISDLKLYHIIRPHFAPNSASRGPTVLDRDRSNKPRGRTRTEVFERPGTMVLKSRESPPK